MSRLAISRRVPGAVLIVTFAMLSGRPSDRFAKCVYLNVAWLLGPMTHEASTVAIFWRTSEPVPVVGPASDRNRSLFSTRFESR
jgi:hypothetical protein